MTSLEILVEDVKKTVHPYGQYFSLQDVSEDSQPFMIPDFAMYAALIVGWGFKEYLQGWLQALGAQTTGLLKGKKKTVDNTQSVTEDVARLAKQVEQLSLALQERNHVSVHYLVQVLDSQPVPGAATIEAMPERFIQPEDLIKQLQTWGLTERKAIQCADELYPILHKTITSYMDERCLSSN